MADQVAVFRLDNRTTCCLFLGVNLYLFKTFPSAKGFTRVIYLGSLLIKNYSNSILIYSLKISHIFYFFRV